MGASETRRQAISYKRTVIESFLEAIRNVHRLGQFDGVARNLYNQGDADTSHSMETAVDVLQDIHERWLEACQAADRPDDAFIPATITELT
ncbi:hypothetical protein F442_16635 [Phytophthora nicotianae P10297]|uniref:Uncharacterized protein n=1 Tax=Phytophthora nicotianae P10297 TaxID=1317064 RepID=W2YJN4_PHYNI|nr:hypothetical protein F442_16635 [Phytophthora nicotianae P10297]